MENIVVFNPAASRADEAEIALQRAAKKFDFRRINTRIDLTAREIVRQAGAGESTRIVVVGGDGTLNAAVNGLAPDFSAELALVPCGTGNDFARSLGLHQVPHGEALRRAFEGTVRSTDIMRVNTATKTVYSLNAANGGLGGCVAQDVHADDKRNWGAAAYWITAISRFGSLPEFKVQIELDDQKFSIDTPGLAIANGRYVGGGFPIAPRASLDDGLLDISIAPMLPTVELLVTGVNFFLGRHESEDRIRMYRSRRVRVRSDPPMPFSNDGEPVVSFDAMFEVVPAALKLVR